MQLLFESKAIKFGQFKTNSGRLAPYFIDFGQIHWGRDLKILIKAYADVILNEYGRGTNHLVGLAYKGIGISQLLASYLTEVTGVDTSYTYNRKEVKEHGEQGSLVGYSLKKGDHVIIIDDVLTKGGSISKAVKLLLPYEVKVIGSVVGIDRQECGFSTMKACNEIKKKYGFPVHSVVTIEEVTQTLLDPEIRQSSLLDNIDLRQIRAYQTQFQGE